MKKLIKLLIPISSKVVMMLSMVLILMPGKTFAAGGVLLVVGDSLSASYGVPPEKSWVTLLNNRLIESSYPMVIVNKSVSGATTQNGADRLATWLQEVHPTHVLLALGSNDGLRGVSARLIKKNIIKMIEQCQKEGATIILVGFQIPANYGPDYAEDFKNVFPALAEQESLPLVPFLLAGFAEDRQYFQGDGLHPNEAAQPIILDNVWKILEPIIKN